VTPVLLDTGCVVALLDRNEQYHDKCAEAVAELSVPLVTSEAVIAESCYLLRDVEGACAAVLQNVESGSFRIPLALSAQAARVRKLLKKYQSVPMDLADACPSIWQPNSAPERSLP
jgi:uncharacterized protein